MKFYVLLISITCLLVSTAAPNASAAPRTKYAPYKISGLYLSEEEYFSLPDFLQVKVRYHYDHGVLEYVKWQRRLGVDYQHYHHWAAALVKFQRAMKPKNFSKRNYLLGRTLSEYAYLLRHCLPQNQFRYLFHLRRGEIFYMLENYSSAADELQMSLNYKNDHKQTYVVLSKVYEALGMKKQAREAMNKANSLKSIE